MWWMEMESNDKLMKNFWKSYETLRKFSKINLGKSQEDKQKTKQNVNKTTYKILRLI